MQPMLEQAEERVLASCPAVTVAQHSQRRCKTIYIECYKNSPAVKTPTWALEVLHSSPCFNIFFLVPYPMMNFMAK